MMRTETMEVKTLYKSKFWHSALFGLFAGVFYLIVLDGSSFGSAPTDSSIQYYGAGIMTVVGFVSWQWRTITAILWACALVITVVTQGAGVFDWLTAVVVTLVMMGPFLNIEGLAFVENMFGTDKDDEPPTSTQD